MNIEKITSEKLGETYYSIKHPTGLQIYVMPKENYSSAYAVLEHVTVLRIQALREAMKRIL